MDQVSCLADNNIGMDEIGDKGLASGRLEGRKEERSERTLRGIRLWTRLVDLSAEADVPRPRRVEPQAV